MPIPPHGLFFVAEALIVSSALPAVEVFLVFPVCKNQWSWYKRCFLQPGNQARGGQNVLRLAL